MSVWRYEWQIDNKIVELTVNIRDKTAWRIYIMYKFKIGDHVRTVYGNSGYVYSYYEHYSNYEINPISYTMKIIFDENENNCNYLEIECFTDYFIMENEKREYNDYFSRIGIYNFLSNKIESSNIYNIGQELNIENFLNERDLCKRIIDKLTVYYNNYKEN